MYADQKDKFSPFSGPKKEQTKWLILQFYSSTHSTDTTIKLFSNPLHLDNVILLFKKIKKKSSNTLLVAAGKRQDVLTLGSNTIRVI